MKNLMDGVTTLSVNSDRTLILIATIFLFTLNVILLILGLSIKIKDKKSVGLFLSLYLLTVTTIGMSKYIPYITNDVYKVTISDNTKYNEFKNKFDILNQKENVYTVKLKG